jgi:aryl-alcohol dehydrogenase (NADP+)
MRALGDTGLQVFPLCLGGNVFGWSADEAPSFAVLDAYAGAGGNFVDTADVYSAWVDGHQGGESETILGRWMKARGNRQRMVIATKVGMAPGLTGLSAATVERACEASLQRLGIEQIDLYYAHRDDPATPLEETLGAFDRLVKQGKVRSVAASNYSAARLREALDISAREGLVRFAALQPNYNLVHRADYEAGLQALCAAERVACLPYYGLARGFLTGKYRPGQTVESVRSSGASAFLNEAGLCALAAVEAVAIGRQVPLAAVALAWLLSRPTVTAPIASARTPEQLAEQLPAVQLTLTAEELARLDQASQPPVAG